MYNPRQYHKWLHSWWCFRAQTSALQQATPFLGATNRDATTVPPMAIRRNTSTLNGTFTGDRCFTASLVSSEAVKHLSPVNVPFRVLVFLLIAIGEGYCEIGRAHV